MRSDRTSRDTRHNKDHDNLKSSLKKGNKSKKHRVVFDESANEFFEADYIIVVRDECYSDEGESEECSGCGGCERHGEPGALSPPDGYKDMAGLFNSDGTLREQAWWEAGDVVLVGERSGTVFTPHHLQLLRRLQRERMLRSTLCADCDAHAALHQPLEMDYCYDEDERDTDRELRLLSRRTGKHIAAGEERPRINSSQQTTPTEDTSLPDFLYFTAPSKLCKPGVKCKQRRIFMSFPVYVGKRAMDAYAKYNEADEKYHNDNAKNQDDKTKNNDTNGKNDDNNTKNNDNNAKNNDNNAKNNNNNNEKNNNNNEKNDDDNAKHNDDDTNNNNVNNNVNNNNDNSKCNNNNAQNNDDNAKKKQNKNDHGPFKKKTRRPLTSTTPCPTTLPTTELFDDTTPRTDIFDDTTPMTDIFDDTTPMTDILDDTTLPMINIDWTTLPTTGMYDNSEVPETPEDEIEYHASDYVTDYINLNYGVIPITSSTTTAPRITKKEVALIKSSTTTTEEPTTITTTEEPTTITTTEMPTTITTTEEPTTIWTTEKPTTIWTTEKPTTIWTTEKPTTIWTTEKPTTIWTTEKPTTITTTKKPMVTFFIPTWKPTKPDRKPFSKKEIGLEIPPELMCLNASNSEIGASFTSEESDTGGEAEDRTSLDGSPQHQRKGGILKGGRLWKSFDNDICENDDQRSTTASDEDGSTTPRSVRFAERARDPCDGETDSNHESDTPRRKDDVRYKDPSTALRMESPTMLSTQQSKVNSAIKQLFNGGRPPPPALEPHLVTSESLRAWNADMRPKTEEAAVRRVAERNALRCSLLRSEARKKQIKQQPQETTSLAERIRRLTCDVDDDMDDDRSSPSGASVEKTYINENHRSDKVLDTLSVNEKAFSSGSTSSSTSTLSAPAPVPTRQQPPDLGDTHQERQKPKPEPRRQFLSTLAPLTACVGSTAQHEGFYYAAAGDRTSGSSGPEVAEHNDAPAPDVVAGTPGAGSDGDDGLAAFARAAAPRTERLRQKYGQDTQPVSSDDEHDDYGFHRRPEVRGIAIKQQLGASDDILQQMQKELQPSPAPTPAPPHSCQRTNATHSWQYCSDSRPQSRASTASAWSKSSDYVQARPCGGGMHVQNHADVTCYVHPPSMTGHAMHAQHLAPNYNTLYANMGCSDSSHELYSSQTSSEQTSPVRAGTRCRRPESPPPIRSHHRLLYLPYSAHDHYPPPEYSQWSTNDFAQMQQQYMYQQQNNSGASTPQQHMAQPQRALYSHPLQIQTMCPVPARYRTVPASQPGAGKQMICYSEKVAAPMYQPAPRSPSRARGTPEGAPAQSPVPPGTSPLATPPNPVYYAMNV